MYDLIDIIDQRLLVINNWVEKWMTTSPLIKSSILSEIKSINNAINHYHKRYIKCKYFHTTEECKYGNDCLYLHKHSSPLMEHHCSDDDNNDDSSYSDDNKNENNNNNNHNNDEIKNNKNTNQNFLENSDKFLEDKWSIKRSTLLGIV